MSNAIDLSVAAAERRFVRDRDDDLIEALAMARLTGMTRDEAVALVNETWSAPWSDNTRKLSR